MASVRGLDAATVPAAVDGRRPDYAKLATYGQKGVKLLLADSTNADREGWTESESIIEPAFERVFMVT